MVEQSRTDVKKIRVWEAASRKVMKNLYQKTTAAIRRSRILMKDNVSIVGCSGKVKAVSVHLTGFVIRVGTVWQATI